MAATDYEHLVQNLYIAYFGRPADPGGLRNMSASLYAINAPKTVRGLLTAAESNPAIAAIINIFGNSDESAALYAGGNTRQFVTAIYEHLLGRAPDEQGLAYWSENIDSGTFTKAMGAFHIMAGASENTSQQGKLDAQLLANRTDAAIYITSKTYNPFHLEYSGDSAAALARKVLDSITASTTASSYRSQADSFIADLVASPHYIIVRDDTGYSAFDRITNKDKNLQISGTAAPAVTVELYVDGATVPLGRAVAGPNSNFSMNIDLAEGRHTLTIKPAGAPHLAASTFQVTVDKTAPAAPTQPGVVAANADGSINSADFANLSDPKMIVDIRELNAEVGQQVELLIDGSPYFTSNSHLGKVTLTADDIWRGNVSFSISRYNTPQGSHVLSTRVYDLAGNPSASGGGTPIFVDTIAPQAPTPAIISSFADGISAAELAAGFNFNVTLPRADVFVGHVLRLILGFGGNTTDRIIDTVLSASDISSGFVRYTFGATELPKTGVVSLSTQMRDDAGNWSYAVRNTVTIDSGAPAAPKKAMTIAALADGMLRPSERSQGIQVEIDLAGTGAVSGDLLEILVNGKPFEYAAHARIWDMEISNGKAVMTIPNYVGWPLTDSVMLSARITDKAGNVGPAGPELKTVLSHFNKALGYSAVSVPANADGGISAAEKAAGVVVNVSLADSQASAGDTISLTMNGVPFGAPLNHSITPSDISAQLVKFVIDGTQSWGGVDGNYVLRATLADRFFNRSSSESTVNIDTIAPGALATPKFHRFAVNASNAGSEVKLTFDIAASGGKHGDKVEVFVDGKALVTTGYVSWGGYNDPTVTVTSNGAEPAWKTDGLKSITARVVDKAGNAGPISGGYSILVDTVAPRLDSARPPVYTDMNNNGKVDAGDTILVSFTEKMVAGANNPVRILARNQNAYTYLDSNSFHLGYDLTQGTLVIGANTGLAKGSEITLIGLTDEAGNSASSAMFTL